MTYSMTLRHKIILQEGVDSKTAADWRRITRTKLKQHMADTQNIYGSYTYGT
jgi:hypothetical protein